MKRVLITAPLDVTGFANVTTCQILVHLYRTYGRLSPANLIANDAKMKSPYDANQPIESFIDQIEDGVGLADAAAAPYTSAQIIAIAYNVYISKLNFYTTSLLPLLRL
jgi:hypothetical protein